MTNNKIKIMKAQYKVTLLLVIFMIALSSCRGYRYIKEKDSFGKVIGYKPGNVELNLDVEAEALFNSSEINDKEFVESLCTLTETVDGKVIKRKKGKLKSFKTDVVANDDMTWDVTTNDEGYTVKIKNVTPILMGNRDKNFFKRYVLEAENGEVIDEVQTGKKGKRYPYLIFFIVEKDDNGSPKEFFVDPKLMAQD